MKSKLALALLLLILCTQNAHAFFIGGGSATVSNIKSVTLPSANLQAIYSVVQYQGWAGSCLRVERSSDHTQLDIGFVNGVCDIASALTFGGAGTLGIAKLYDESGAGCDAVQATFANMPVLTNLNMQNSIPGATFWNTSATMTMCNGLTTNTQSQTVFSVQSPIAVSGAVWNINSTYTGGNSLLMSVDTNGDDLLNTAAFLDTTVYSNMQPEVTVMTSGASSRTYQVNNTLKTGLTSTASATTAGGNIGTLGATSGFSFFGQTYLIAVYNTVIGQTTIQSNINNLLTTFSIPTNNIARVIWDGDSITQGAQSTYGVNNTFQTLPLLKENIYARNVGVFGRTLATVFANQTKNIINSFVGGLTNIDVMAAGENDICTGGANGTTIFNSYTTPYVANEKAAGYVAVIGTLIFDNSCATGSPEAERQTYNGLVRSNAASLGYNVVDYDAITQLQNPQTPGYSSDGVHPTTLGYGLMAQKLATVLNTLLP